MPQANPTGGANSERLEDVTFPQARIDINDNLEALQTLNSGNGEPSTKAAFMQWLDTNTDPAVLKIRNSANNDWIEVGSLSATDYATKGITAIANGGTGATTASAGIAALLPDQSGNSDKVLKTDGSALSWATAKPAGSVIETFTLPCANKSITVGSGTYTSANVTAAQTLTTTYADLTGSSIAYTPPAGTQLVIYKFQYYYKYVGIHALWHTKFYIDSDEVTKARHTNSHYIYSETTNTFEWPIVISGSADTTTGQIAANGWTSNKTLKMQSRIYDSPHVTALHETQFWDGASQSELSIPTISITAIS